MFIIESYSTAVILCIVTMLCWGSWANTQKMNSKTWRFELFYWDYSLGILFSSIILALTFGSFGDHGRGFLIDLKQADFINLKSAFIGGILFNAANILLVAAIGIAGMSVAFPVGIGIALILGVLVNYVGNPVGDPRLIMSGVALITLAIILNARAYKQLNAGTNSKVSQKGIILSILSGIMMGFFYKYVADSMTINFSVPEIGKLTPYSALVLFAIGIFISSLLFNTLQMRMPFSGESVTFSAYFKGLKKDHLIGMLGGSIWFMGMALSILASEKAGTAVSYGLGQGATVVAAVWGIFIWKEFQAASQKTKRTLNVMLAFYVIGLTLIIMSKY